MIEQPKIKQIVFDEKAIQQRVSDLGKQISNDYRNQDLVLICVLKGTLYFFADLTRSIDIPVSLDFISMGVYPGTTNKTGIVRITKDLDVDITGKQVLVVEDIIRTGLTTGYLVQNLEAKKPAGIKICTLLSNPDQQLVNVPIAYSGFEVSNIWLMGYGMDIGEKWRNLPYIVEVEK